MYIEDDLVSNPGGLPTFGYGIYSIHKWGDLSITQNTLEAMSSLPPNDVSLVYIIANHQLGGAMPKHPVVTCNSTKNSNIGFRFLGQNGHTQWEGNLMCNHWAGLGIFKGFIGQQGSPAAGSGNFWEYTAPCNVWPSPQAINETYLEDSDPISSELWVYNTTSVAAPLGIQGYYPNSNVASGVPGMPYLPGVTLYTVAVQSTNNPDCLASSFAPPNWRKSETTNTSIQNAEEFKEQLSLFPNPTSGALYIQSVSGNTINSVIVSDITGKIVYQNYFNRKEVEVHLFDLAEGIYLIEVSTETELTRKKLIISR